MQVSSSPAEVTAAYGPCAGEPAQRAHGDLPEPAQRYLRHAIGSMSKPADRARLRMHGELKLRSWRPFEAEQVLDAENGFVWKARIGRGPLFFKGSDRLEDGHAAMEWRLWGLLPIVRAAGPDVDESAIGRFHSESIWLPSMLLPEAGARWEQFGDSDVVVHLTDHGHDSALWLRIHDSGALAAISLQRWGNPDGRGYGYHSFSAFVEQERTFDGYTVPSKVRAGWGTLQEGLGGGEFFRATIDAAEYERTR